MNSDANAPGYVLGHTSPELTRLQRQAEVYRAFTDEVLRSAGLRAGMSVLDVGCGVGDVSMAAGRLVGPTGAVRGIDRSQDALAAGRARMDAEGMAQVRLERADIDDHDDTRYDAVIGRFILLHRVDPVATIRSLTRRLRRGGVIAFIEMDLSTAEAVPPMPLFSQAMDWIGQVYLRDGFHKDMASRLYACFKAAGTDPIMKGTVRVEGGPDAYAYAYVAETVRSLLPRIEALGIADRRTVGVDDLEHRLREASLEGSHCFFYPRMIGAFATVPG